MYKHITRTGLAQRPYNTAHKEYKQARICNPAISVAQPYTNHFEMIRDTKTIWKVAIPQILSFYFISTGC